MLSGLSIKPRRRKCFVSYHHADEGEVQAFIQHFDHDGDLFICRGLGASMPGGIFASVDPTYIMGRIRKDFLRDSTITLVMIGNCTWSRKYCDWEIQASLRSGDKMTPNGLLGIRLPSFRSNKIPDRLALNTYSSNSLAILGRTEAYARVIDYPQTDAVLWNAIEDAFRARDVRKHLITNPRDNFVINKACPQMLGHL